MPTFHASAFCASWNSVSAEPPRLQLSKAAWPRPCVQSARPPMVIVHRANRTIRGDSIFRTFELWRIPQYTGRKTNRKSIRRGNHGHPVHQESAVENNHPSVAKLIYSPTKRVPLTQTVRRDNVPKANPPVQDQVTSAAALKQNPERRAPGDNPVR